MPITFRIKRSKGQFMSVIEGANGEPIYSSERVHNHEDCVSTVNILKKEGDNFIDETVDETGAVIPVKRKLRPLPSKKAKKATPKKKPGKKKK